MLREELLAHTAYVSCSVPILSFQRDLAAHYSGGLYRLESNGVTASAAARWTATARAWSMNCCGPATGRQART